MMCDGLSGEEASWNWFDNACLVVSFVAARPDLARFGRRLCLPAVSRTLRSCW